MKHALRFPAWLASAVLLACSLALSVPATAAAGADASARQPDPNVLVAQGSGHYAPGALPDRIVAAPLQDAATGFSISWRTRPLAAPPVLEIAIAQDGPDQWPGDQEPPRRIQATRLTLASDNGTAQHHHAVADRLQPGTLYAWRVQGQGTWSPWRHLRTAAPAGAPLEFLYFGDTQNQNASLTTRVMHEAIRHAPKADLAIFAGDLVSEAVLDDEWGEWFDATAPLATLTLAPVAGNHEYFEENEDTPQERRVLGEPWKAHFALPGNGADAAPHTSYWFDYQGIRFAMLDGTSALDLGTAARQAAWLDGVLSANPLRWSIVVIHQPFYSPRAGRDNALLREHLQPVIERHGVDLVLQGHDHAYGRRSGEHGDTPVYLTSVAGAKQYRVSGHARATMAPVGEDTQLFQVLRLDGNRLDYEAHTATGRLYDAFTLEDLGAEGKRLVERTEGRIPERRCRRQATLTGRADRCWE